MKLALSWGITPTLIFSNVLHPAASSASSTPVSKFSIAVIYILDIIPIEHIDWVTTPQKAPGPVTLIQIRAHINEGIVLINNVIALKIYASHLGTMFVADKKLTGIDNKAPIIVPKKAIDIVSNNKYPHVTAFINQYPPKASNDVLEKILSNKHVLDKYNNIINENEIMTNGDYYFKYDMKINKENISGYLILFEKSVEIEGVMHAFE